MQVCSWVLKHRQVTVGRMEFEALVPRQAHTAGLYWNPGEAGLWLQIPGTKNLLTAC